MLRKRYLEAATFGEAVRTAESNREMWASMQKRARAPEEYVRRAAALGASWHLLVLSEDWCGDAFNSVPVVAALAEAAPNLELRVLARDANPDLMDAHLTGGARSIPVVIVLDERFEEVGWWGPRPRELQEWVVREGKQLPPADRYREIRRWYARDAGRSTLEEVVGVLEGAARSRRVA